MKKLFLDKPVISRGGYAVYEKENKIFFVNYNTRHIYIFIFILALLSFINFITGILNFYTHVIFGVILLFGAFFLLLIFMLGLLKIKKLKNKNLINLEKTAIIDLENKVLLDKDENFLAHLSGVSFNKIWQITDSSKAIEARWKDGKVILARGLSLVGGGSQFYNYLINKKIIK